VDDYRDYEKALAALGEAYNILYKSPNAEDIYHAAISELRARMTLIKAYLNAVQYVARRIICCLYSLPPSRVFCTLHFMNCMFSISNSQPTTTELFQSQLYRSGTVFCSISYITSAPSLPVFCFRLKTYFFELCYP